MPEAARPERAEAPSPGQRPGNYGRKRAALSGRVGLTCKERLSTHKEELTCKERLSTNKVEC